MEEHAKERGPADRPRGCRWPDSWRSG